MSDRVVVDVSDLAPGAVRAVEVGERHVLVCHAEGRFYAIENRCPHAAVPLDAGRLRGCLLECPFHGGLLDVRDGSPQGQPIRRPVTTYSVRDVAGGLEIQLAPEAASATGG